MIFLYIIGTFIAVTIAGSFFNFIGEGPNAGAWFFYGSIIIGILLSINDKLDEDKARDKKSRFTRGDE
ncbi:hypothetical protein D3C74_264350 [compost metagenome]